MIWVSLHLFYDGSLDFLLKKGVQPFINKNKINFENWFFIRYMEGGQHIRLRLKIKAKELPIFKNLMSQHFSDFFKKFPSESFNYPDQIFPNNSIQFIDYETETIRYGGKKGLEISEQFFNYSSELILDFLNEDLDYENKLLLAALINYNLGLICFTNQEHQHTFFENIATDWRILNLRKLQITERDFINNIKTIKAEAKPIIQPLLLEYLYNIKNDIEDDFSDWRKQINLIYQQLSNHYSHTKSITTILKSYIHMNNNRLGISNSDESLVSELLIWRTLDSND